MTSFVPNGLLGSSSLSMPVSEKDIPESLSFAPNGLLGSVDNDDPGSTMDTDSPSLFQSNGLLSNSSLTQLQPSSASTNHSSYDTEDSGPSLAPEPLSFGKSTVLPALSVRVTTHEGKTFFIRKKKKALSIQPELLRPKASSSRAYSKLLDTPVHRLREGIDREKALPSRAQTSDESTSDANAFPHTLWVDKYQPERFTDMVGNERVARDAMSWLKQWDWCVFGKRRGKKRAREGEEEVQLDEYHRPRERILLLSGPPGLGKTTLAHVIGQHAGYDIMEINASDARSGSIIDDRVRPTLESGSRIGSSKPVLMILDEVDGATGSGDQSHTFIHKLVNMITAKPKATKGRGQKRDAIKPILRPIICICNDVNAASLAKLRPHAYQVRFARPADVHLVKRLKEICTLEGLKAESRALGTLVSAAKGDLRSCLNTLQFIKTNEVTETVMRRATSGMKEGDASVLSVLSSLFTPLSKKKAKDLGLTEEEEARYVGRLTREIDALDRDSTIASGCFGHYATRRRHDANLSRHHQANEWLGTYDMFSSAMYSDGEFALHQYLPYTLVPFYPLFQERGAEKVERNNADWEHMQLTRTNEEIYKSLSRGALGASLRKAGAYQQLLGSPILQLEFAPYINRIISPPLRPVNSQVIRPQEKALFTRLVDIMASLDLRFVQERAEDGTLSYRLDPPLDVFVTYDGKRASDISVSRYAVRHLVAAEIDAKLLARDTGIVEKTRDKRGNPTQPAASREVNQEADNGLPSKRMKTDNQTVIEDKPPTDFFGRLVTTPSNASVKAAVRKNVEKNYRVTFRYLEGNSAAVRKPIKVNAFL